MEFNNRNKRRQTDGPFLHSLVSALSEVVVLYFFFAWRLSLSSFRRCHRLNFAPLTFTKPVTISSSSQVAFRRLATFGSCRNILNILQGRGMFSSWSRTTIKPRLVDAEVTCGGSQSLSSSIKEEAVEDKILDRLCWCEEVDVNVSEGWGISTSSNHRHLLCSISHNSGCWLRPGSQGEETAIWHSRSSGSSILSLQFRSKSALFQVCWTARISVWVFLLSSPSLRGVERALLMPAMSNNSKASDERSKMKTKFITNLIEMMQNIQSVQKNAKTSLLDRKNKYWQSIWRGGEEWVVNTPNIQYGFFIWTNWPINFQFRSYWGLIRFLDKDSCKWSPFSVDLDQVTIPPYEGTNSAFKLSKQAGLNATNLW